MKNAILVIVSSLVLLSAGLAGAQGDAVFQAQRCGVCHKPDTGKTTPSLKEIAQAYMGKEGQLVQYIKGEAGPIIRAEKSSTMNRYIEKTRLLTDEERKALAGFILGRGK